MMFSRISFKESVFRTMKVKVDYFDWTTFIAQKQHVGDSDKHVICKKKKKDRFHFCVN